MSFVRNELHEYNFLCTVTLLFLTETTLYVLTISDCCFEYLCYLFLCFTLFPSAGCCLFSSHSFCMLSRSLLPSLLLVAVIHLKVPAASTSLKVIKFQKKFKECNLPTAHFQGPVYARMLFLQVSTFKPPPHLHTTFLFFPSIIVNIL